MRGRKFRSAVYWQEVLEPKGVNQNGRKTRDSKFRSAVYWQEVLEPKGVKQDGRKTRVNTINN